MLEIIKELLGIIILAISALTAAIAFFVKYLGKSKQLDSTIILLDKIKLVVIEAEKLTDKSGDEKLKFALEVIEGFCLNNNIPFDKDFVKMMIEQFIELSKKVNIKKK